jgi:hypothetical protein
VAASAAGYADRAWANSVAGERMPQPRMLCDGVQVGRIFDRVPGISRLLRSLIDHPAVEAFYCNWRQAGAARPKTRLIARYNFPQLNAVHFMESKIGQPLLSAPVHGGSHGGATTSPAYEGVKKRENHFE